MLLCATGMNCSAQQWQSMTFRADAPGIDENPLRGWVPFAATETQVYRQQGAVIFPHSMEWFYLPLSDVVKGPELYAWSALESQLQRIAGRGHQAVFRFYVDYPGQASGIPQYLMDAGLKTYAYSDGGNGQGKSASVAPDYSDPRLIDCMEQFIRALGAKYDGDARIAYITVGLYGFWGEWHVERHPLPGEPAGWAMTQKDKDALLQVYAASFNRTPLLVRYPSVTDDHVLLAGFGYHDDSFLQDTIGGAGWLFWPAMQKAGMAEAWKLHPMGGEIRPELQTGVWNAKPDAAMERVSDAIATTHATWMMDDKLFVQRPTVAEWQNALLAQRTLGYTFYCAATRIAPGKGGSTVVTVQVENRGVAPIYYAWPAELEALDVKGKTIASTKASWPLPALEPGQTAEWSAELNATPADVKTLLLQIANPMPGGHPVAFANAEMGTVRPGWLTIMKPVRR